MLEDQYNDFDRFDRPASTSDAVDRDRVIGYQEITFKGGREAAERTALNEIGIIWSHIRISQSAEIASRIMLTGVHVGEARMVLRIETTHDLHHAMPERIWMSRGHSDKLDMHPPTARMREAVHDAVFPNGRKALDEILTTLSEMDRADAASSSAGIGMDVADRRIVAERTPASSIPNRFVRISIETPGGWNESSSNTRLQTLVAFLKSKYRLEPDETAYRMSIMGTLNASEFLSVVLHVTEDLARELSIENPHAKAHRFDEADLNILSWDMVPQLAVELGCGVGMKVEAAPSKGAVAMLSSSMVCQHLMLLARISLDLLTTWAGISITAWRRSGQPRIRASATSLARRVDVALWDMLESCLPEDMERIQAARTKIRRFERISGRWGDAESAHTASSVDGLVAKISRELEDVVMWAKPMETLAASARVLATLERLADRADEEGDRLSSAIIGTLDATCRYVDAKLDDAGLKAIQKDDERATYHDKAQPPERIGY
jgi:hypothetical protein